LQLLISGYNVSVGKLGENEIDFVAEKNGEKKYFQVAYLLSDKATIEREFGNLLKIKDNYPKYLLTLDFDNTSIDGIQKLNVIDWLLQ